MVRGEGLQVLEEGMKTMDPDENEIYKFLGIEQGDGIRTKMVFQRVKEEVSKRVKIIANTELIDTNLIIAINMKVIPVTVYAMNMCRFNVGELKELNQTIKRELRGNKKRWKRETVLENERRKLVWDFEFHLRKITTTRIPNLNLEDKAKKKIWLCKHGKSSTTESLG